MRSLIFGDLHSHNYREFSKLNKDGMNTRLLEGILSLAKITLSGLEEKVEDVWFVGDLYHLKNNLDSQVIQATVTGMRELAEQFPLVLVPGHHDLYMWSTNPIMLELLKDFSKNITVITKPGWYKLRKDVDFYIEPCTRKVSDLMKRIETVSTVPEKSIFLGHQDLIGMEYGGYKVERGLDPKILSKKFKYSFVGHYHNPGIIQENVVSVGAPLQHSFNDAAKMNSDSNFDENAKRGWFIYDDSKPDRNKNTTLKSIDSKLKFIKNTEAPEFIDYVYDPEKKEKEFIPGNWEKDYYRIKVIGNHELPERLKRIKWKRVSYELRSVKKGRTTISFSDKKEDLLMKYVEVKAGDHLDKKVLIEIGREYL